MILPPPGFAQPNPDASTRKLAEQEFEDLIALAKNREVPPPPAWVDDVVRFSIAKAMITYETRDPALQLAGKETKP